MVQTNRGEARFSSECVYNIVGICSPLSQLATTYHYERLIHLMKDANLQFENISTIGLYDNVFEAGILLCRRVSYSLAVIDFA
jgi:hypothetical protein